MTLPQPLYALVTKSDIRASQTAGRYCRMDLRTHAGNWPANIWSILEDTDYPQKGDVLLLDKFKDQTDTKHANLSLKIENIKKINLEDIPEELRNEVIKTPAASKERIDKAWEIITHKSLFKEGKNYEFTMKCLSEFSEEDIKKWPAAVAIHHHYQGGWLIHVSEVLLHAKSLVKSVEQTYPGLINNDVVMSSAIVHDLGKFKTYYLDNIGMSQKYATESSIGHFFYSMELVNKTAKEMNMNKDFTEEVLHCIASHHGRVEFGSIKPTMSLEALIVASADNISSKCGFIDTKIKDIKQAGGKIENNDFLRARGGERYIITQNMKTFEPKE